MKIYQGKVIKITEEDYESLHEMKFDLRIDTFRDVVHFLIKEHKKCNEVEAPA